MSMTVTITGERELQKAIEDLMYQAKQGTSDAVSEHALNYAPFVEFGTRPHFPPLEPIREWCRRHSIPEEAAYAIALKISRTGQPARPFLFPAYEQERPKFEAVIMAAWRKIKAGA
jgi:hypothetical protein